MEDEDIVSINDDLLLLEYWEDARSIISDFNELGGGPEEDEDEAYGYLEKISEPIKKGRHSQSGTASTNCVIL